MGGCASSKPKVKDEDREPYGSSAASAGSRHKSKAGGGDQSKSKQTKERAPSSSQDPAVAPVVVGKQSESPTASGKPKILSVEIQQDEQREEKPLHQAESAPIVKPSSSVVVSEVNVTPAQSQQPVTAVPSTSQHPEATRSSKSDKPCDPGSQDGPASIQVSVGHETSSTVLQPVQKDRVSDSVAVKRDTVDVSQVKVAVSPDVKQLQQPVAASTTALTTNQPNESSAGGAKQHDKDVHITNGHVECTVSKSSPTRTSDITAANDKQTLSSDEKRKLFVSSVVKSAEPSKRTSSSALEQRSPEKIDSERVDIKAVDPKMEIFDALHSSKQQKAAPDAGDSHGKTELVAGEKKLPQAVDSKTTIGAPSTSGELQNGTSSTKKQDDLKPGTAADKKIEKIAETHDDQKEKKILESSTTVSATGTIQKGDSDVVVSPTPGSRPAPAEADAQTPPKLTAVPSPSSSLPRPTSVVTGQKNDSTSPAGNNKLLPSATSEEKKPNDDTTKVDSKLDKSPDRSVAISKKEEITPTSKVSRLPTFSATSPHPPVQQQTSPAAPDSASKQSNGSASASAAVSPKTSRTASTASPVRGDKTLSTGAEVADSGNDPDKIKSILTDLSDGNKLIESSHQLAPKTRVKIIQLVDQWFNAKNRTDGDLTAAPGDASNSKTSVSRVLVITGQPGAGKTCLAAELDRRFSGRNQLAGSHFFHRRMSDVDHNRATAMLLNLARRLIDKNLPGYAASLPLFSRLSEAASVNDVKGVFSLLVEQPLRSVNCDQPQRLMIIIDGLDECDPADKDEFCQIINEFEKMTPEWLYLAITTRIDDQATSKLSAERHQMVELRADLADAENVGDIKRYLRDSMSKFIDRISLDGALAQLAKNAEGNFLCAKLLKNRLDELPASTKLALRDISLSFPVGTTEIIRQTFQALHDRLSSATDKNRNKSRPTAYATIASLLAVAMEPLHQSAFGVENEEALVQSAAGGVLTLREDGMVSVCHNAVVEWLLSEKTVAPLGVNVNNARQVMAEAVVSWLSPVVSEEDGSDELPSGSGEIHPSLARYAVKHAIYHLTDASKQQENIAKTLCSLKFVEHKLKIKGIRLSNLLADYTHSHIQSNYGSSSKLVTLESYMKRNSELIEQIALMERFVSRRGPCIVSVGADLTLHVAANYPTANRVQHNARLDLGDNPWLEDITAVADSKSVSRKLSGTIVDVDMSTDQRLIAIVTTEDPSLSPQPLLYIFNTATMEPINPDPVDLRTVLADSSKLGLCVRFIPAGTTPSLFVGSFTQFVAARGGKPIDTGFDVASVKLSDRYTIECCAVGGSMLACAANTLPWGGRSLHVILFDVQTKKCSRVIEILKFRFGGSAQYGVKACALSSDGSQLVTCVKQASRAELKVIIWSTSKGETVASVDVEDDTLMKCCIFTGEQPAVFITSGVRGQADKDLKFDSTKNSYVWQYQDKTSKPFKVDRHSGQSLGHAVGQTAAWAQWRRPSTSSQLVLSLFKRGAVGFSTGDSVMPDRKFAVFGLQDVTEMLSLDKSVIFLSKNVVSLFLHQNLQSIEFTPQSPGGTAQSFAAADVRIESVSFMPRSDDPLISYWPLSSASDDQQIGLTACSLSAKSDEIAVMNKLFDREPSAVAASYTDSANRVFVGSEVVACSADGSTVLMRCRDSVQAVDVNSGTRRILPRYSDLPAGKSSTAKNDNIRMCVVSSKDSLVGVVYEQMLHMIYLFDVKTTQSGRPLQQICLQSDADSEAAENQVTDFSFLPASGYVIASLQKLADSDKGDTLAVWNQRTGALVNSESGLKLSFVRASLASDRLVVVQRQPTNDGTVIILRNNENRFSKTLDIPVTWSPEPCSTDLEFSVDGTVLIGVGGGYCRVWNAGNGEILRSFNAMEAPEIVGMPTNAHALLHDPAGERLLLVDVTSSSESPPVVAAVPTDGRLCRKWTGRRLRISPRGGTIVGSTEEHELRLYMCHNMTSIKRQTTLQIMKLQPASK